MEDWFARPCKTLISPSELNSEGVGQALVLRYAGCQLRCPLCYAWRYAWNIQNGHPYDVNMVLHSLEKLPKLASKKIVWIRIQGGEPLLNYDRTITTIKYAERALDIVRRSEVNYYSITRAVIQTNALALTNMNSVEIDSVKNHLKEAAVKTFGYGRIIFEVSIKSSHEPAILNQQIKGYRVLLERILIPLWMGGIDNIAMYPIAGLGPSIDFHNTWLIPIENKALPNEVPLFHSSFWSSSFKNLVNEFINDIVPNYTAYNDFKANTKTNNGTKNAIEELEPTKFQSAWISRYAERSAPPPIDTLLRRTSDKLDTQWTSKILFGRNQYWFKVMKAIPLASNPEQLLDLVKSMNEYFYPSHPIGHYPYL